MNSLILRSVFLILGSSFGLVAQAETTGWSWGPFASTTTTSSVGAQSKASSSWWPQWKTPDIAGSVKKATTSVKKTTSNAWNSTTRTTKRAWKKTTEFLDPFPNDTKTVSSTSSPSSGGSSSWFGGSKKDEKPATVQDFLRQERP